MSTGKPDATEIGHVRFGGGPSEKGQVIWHLAGGLPDRMRRSGRGSPEKDPQPRVPRRRPIGTIDCVLSLRRICVFIVPEVGSREIEWHKNPTTRLQRSRGTPRPPQNSGQSSPPRKSQPADPYEHTSGTRGVSPAPG